MITHDKLSTRLAIILTKLNSRQRLTITELAEEFGVSAKTIKRDFARLSYMPIEQDGKHYFLEEYALGKLSFDDIKTFATLSGIKSLYPSLDDRLLTDLLNIRTNRSYLIRGVSYEKTAHDVGFFAEASAAVLRSETVEFDYKEKHRKANPYRVVNNNGVWYLLAEEEGMLKNFTLSKITNFVKTDELFVPKDRLISEIENGTSNWFSSTQFEVVLEIDSVAKEYFDRKEFLPNIQTVRVTDQSITISTFVSFDDEILRIVREWIPYIKIISPERLRDKLACQLEKYLKKY